MATCFGNKLLNTLKIQERRISFVLLAIIIILQILILYPQIGQGFIKDDFNWIENAAPTGKLDLLYSFSKTTGFYRPIVGVSFGLQYQLFGLSSKPFAIFNLLLHLMNILLLFFLLRRISKSYLMPLVIVFFFSFNFKGVLMGVGWISGRTTLLFSFFTFIAIHFFLTYEAKTKLKLNKLFLALCINLFFLLALLSKETAAALPIFIFSYYFLKTNQEQLKFLNRVKNGVINSVMLLPAFFIYLVMRFESDAFFSHNAPKCYKYDFSPLVIIKNFTEYVLRSSLLLFVFVFIIILILLLNKFRKKIQFNISDIINSNSYFGLIWFISFLMPILLIPYRSDIYVYFSQVGALIFLTIIVSNILKDYQKYKININVFVCFFFIIIFVQVSSFVGKSFSIYYEGKNSANFISQLSKEIKNIPKNTKFVIVDYDYKYKYSPSKTISYGLLSFLNIQYPELKLKGKIITSKKSNLINNNSLFFKWSNKKLSTTHTF